MQRQLSVHELALALMRAAKICERLDNAEAYAQTAKTGDKRTLASDAMVAARYLINRAR